MGVHGLWELLQSTARPVTLESLEGQIIAVDVSIWLHQTVKGMRDRFGATVPNAHLLGLFHRICKLLFYRIKPVFVFDGAVPLLKRQTMAERRNRQEAESESSAKVAKRLLKTMLKHHAIGAVLGTNGSFLPSSLIPSSSSQMSVDDVFRLPPLQDGDMGRSSDQEMENDPWEQRQNLRNDPDYQELEQIDITSDDFLSLPAEIQHEILCELKMERRKNSWAKMDQLPKESHSFSNYQLEKLMKQSRLSRMIDDCRKTMNMASSGAIESGIVSETGEVRAERVLSEDAHHFILLKGLRKGLDAEVNTNEFDVGIMGKLNREEPVRNEGLLGKVGEVPEIIGDVPGVLGDLSEGRDKVNKKDNNAATMGRLNEVQNDSVLGKVSDLPEIIGDLPRTLDVLPERSNEFANNDTSRVEIFDKRGKEGDASAVNSTDMKREAFETSDKANFSVAKSNLTEFATGISNPEKLSANAESPKKNATTSMSPAALEKTPEPNETSFENGPEIVDIISDSGRGSPSSDSDSDFIEVPTIDGNPIQSDNAMDSSKLVGDTRPETLLGELSSTELPSEIEESGATSIPPESTIDEDHFGEEYRVDEENEFAGMSQNELEDLQSLLEREANELEQERGAHQRNATTITDQMYSEAQELLRLFGLPYIVSPTEAESQCAHLDLTNQTTGTITDDSDVWLFGGRKVYKNFCRQNKDLELYQASDILTHLMLDREKLICLGLLCGTDYTPGVKGVGPVTALEILAEFKSQGFEGLKQFKEWWLEAQTQVRPPQETKVKSKLRHLDIGEGFPSAVVAEAYRRPVVDNSKEEFSWGSPDLDLLRKYATEKFGWDKNKADGLLFPILKKLRETQLQSHVTSYFRPMAVGQKFTSKSKRVERLVRRLRNAEDCTEEEEKRKKYRLRL